jgi:hypothetical protein
MDSKTGHFQTFPDIALNPIGRRDQKQLPLLLQAALRAFAKSAQRTKSAESYGNRS